MTPRPLPEGDANRQWSGFHPFVDQGRLFGSFEVWRSPISRQWFWWTRWLGQEGHGEAHGPFPTAEGAYLSAIGD